MIGSSNLCSRKACSLRSKAGAGPDLRYAGATGRTNGIRFRIDSRWAIGLIILLLSFLSLPSAALAKSAAAKQGPAANVLPFIGTGMGPGGNQNLFPGASMPFGMVQLSPDTESHGYGYHYYQPNIQGFSMTHMSGPGCANEGDVFFTATTGPVKTGVTDFESPYSHNQESAGPGYYQVMLRRWGVDAQFTATDRTGLAQFTFPAGITGNILIPISHTLNYTAAAHVRVKGNREITGYVVDRAFCGRKRTYKVYFVMIFTQPFSSFGTWQGHEPGATATLSPNGHTATQTRHGQWIGAYVRWPSSAHSRTITAKIGISYVDLAGAENNLKQEAAQKDFDQVRTKAWNTWNKALSMIDVSGGTPRERTIFYTALYHSLLMPSIFSDADGRYLGFESKQVHSVTPGHPVYCNYSGWDVYRSEMPLLALIEPRRMNDIAESIVLMCQQGGWIGRWPQINLYTNVMAGSPLTTILCNAWLDGLHGFDIKTAWEGMLKDATQAPPSGRPYVGQEGIQWINKLHYVPNDKISYGSVSQIQEDCIAYASLYYLAKQLGETQAVRMLYQRALYYRNVFDHHDRFFRPRNADGQWVPNFDPAREHHQKGMPPTGFIEGSGWHYQWFAPADLAWVIQATGKNLFNHRLEKFFSYPKPGWYGQYYNPYNETDLEAPFEFNFSGMPWETQRVVRRILKENYTSYYNGIPGNDDCGEMSSWAVLSMMGIYTVDPASLAYELVSPVFHKVVIHLHAPYPGNTFTITTSRNAEAKPYIQSVKLNGHIHTQNWIRFGAISAGGKLHFALGKRPDKSWGSAPTDAPPSLSEQYP